MLDTRDFDEAVDFTRRAIGEHRAETTKQASSFRTRVHHAPLSSSGIVYVDSHAWLSVESPPQRDFRVFLGLRGTLEHKRGREAYCSGPGAGVIHSHGSEFRVLTVPNEHIIVTLNEKAVLREASLREDGAVGSLDFEPGLDLRDGAGAALSRIVHFIANELEEPDGLLAGSRTMQLFEKSLVELLLDSQPHGARHDGPRGLDGGPAVVRRVDELIHSELDSPLTVGELAMAAGVSARTLFRTYRRYRGRSPIQALREARLARVRGELLEAKAGATVTQAAIRCGFTHLGRFSEVYRRAFGETPSTTLRRAQEPSHYPKAATS